MDTAAAGSALSGSPSVFMSILGLILVMMLVAIMDRARKYRDYLIIHGGPVSVWPDQEKRIRP